MEGPDLIPVQGTARVSVVNRRLPEAPTSHLMYSNHPERVTRFGTLFAARLSSHTGANRLLYHHQSNMTQAAVFVVELINDGDAPASVQVVGGAAGPVRDTVWVGYRAASIFVRDFLDDVGAVVDLPAGSRVAITCQRLAPELTISGLTRLRQLSGPRPVLVRVAADIPGDPRTAPGELAVTANPWAASAAVGSSAVPESPHVYAEPQKAIQARYDVGGLWAFVSVGKVPLRAVNGSETRLEGNYGVFYDVDFTLSNPTAKPANLRLTFEPAAGLAGGVFLVDGQFVEIPQTKGPEPSTLSRYTLAPGETRVVKVKTLPLSGSNYPIRLAVHP
jgi:hypothetical protein